MTTNSIRRYRTHNRNHPSYWRMFMKSLLIKRKLKLVIEIKRKDMYTKAKQLGLTHPEVVKCSKELDVLLNKYQP